MNQIIHVRPDVLLCEIDQLSCGRSLGFGEVELSDPTPNIGAVTCDLLRLADLSQHVSAKLKASFSFQIHGKVLVHIYKNVML